MYNNSIIFLRKLLFPFSWIYGVVVFIRNQFFDWGIFHSTVFSVPVVCIGNITVGGTGKTPHTEWLLQTLSTQYRVGVLSRGYGRKSKGFRYVAISDTAAMTGDEPLQMKRKFPQVTFAVDANRRRGIQRLINEKSCNLILLDDAFQHRSVSAFFNIVLMDYNRLPHKDYYLPSGNLRDGRYSLRRADCLLITKCPNLTEEQRHIIQNNYKQYKIPIYFSVFRYNRILNFSENKQLISLQGKTVLLVTAIANTVPLHSYLEEQQVARISELRYPDHYSFSTKDLEKMVAKWEQLQDKDKIILTTEKDRVKLLPLFNNPHFSEFLDVVYTLSIGVDLGKYKEPFFSQLNEKLVTRNQ